jgi:lysophospholipase L1-like esterase
VHHVSKSTSYLTGVHGTAPNGSGAPFEHWYQLAGVDVKVRRKTRVVAVLGDSITDGHASGADRNERWTDVLAERLQAQAATRTTSVLNLGISGNRLLKEGSGPSGMARFSYDILDQPGLSTLVVFEGTNDIGKLSREGPVTTTGRREIVTGLIAAYRQLIEQAHLRGIRVVGATLLPFGGTAAFRSDADAMADREAVNAWIREPGHFDAVIDFDAVVRDPAHPERLRPAYDSGDLLHPSVAGYLALGQSVPLRVLMP